MRLKEEVPWAEWEPCFPAPLCVCVCVFSGGGLLSFNFSALCPFGGKHCVSL